ncbi:isopentenyl-diphosphate Delta-isomerase [Candidatus Woesearchaeota archaeon]|nr:isopentenyl-diphosphate Delta-isomerase [Candidatus Woesearchaeota archaeon]
MEKVILVDKNDNETGAEEKIKAHKDGKLHRAFSIFIFNSKNEMLIHKRHRDKYHSGGLWTNACCSHPRPGEKTEDAAKRRLKEEMGISCGLRLLFKFIYKKKFSNGLTENELDYVFAGNCNTPPHPDKKEVEEWKWVSQEELKKNIKENPEKYTHWFKIAVERVIN